MRRPTTSPSAAGRRREEGAKKSPSPKASATRRPARPTTANKLDTTDPAFGAGYPAPLPYAVCGYTPPQLQSAYGLTSQIDSGSTEAVVTVAIVDAYVSPTLFSDAQHYAS